MLLQIKEINHKTTWENFLERVEKKTFLHSWNWGKFCQKIGEKIWQWGIYNHDQLIAVALVEKKAAKRGTFLLVPHGPIVKDSLNNLVVIEILTQELKELAGQEKAAFVRINPILERNENNIKIFKKLGFRNAPLQMHPESSWKLNLDPSEEELFAQMRKTTKYVIRQSQKNSQISFSTSVKMEDIKTFSQLHDSVSKRQKFVPFSLEYLEKEFNSFNQDNEVCLFFGYSNKEIAAGSFVIFWSQTAFYHHAVSVPKFAKLSVPYFLLWEAIKEAKKRNCLVFDFWGFVDPNKQPRHPWAGPTLFKMGFGGQAHEYVQTQDLVISKKYWFTYIFEKIRKIKRGL